MNYELWFYLWLAHKGFCPDYTLKLQKLKLWISVYGYPFMVHSSIYGSYIHLVYLSNTLKNFTCQSSNYEHTLQLIKQTMTCKGAHSIGLNHTFLWTLINIHVSFYNLRFIKTPCTSDGQLSKCAPETRFAFSFHNTTF